MSARTNRSVAIQAFMDQPFTVEIAENPSTGFRHEITFCSPELEVMANTYCVDDGDRGTLGRGGRRSLTIMARAPGSYRLELVATRRWSGERLTVQVLAINVSPPLPTEPLSPSSGGH